MPLAHKCWHNLSSKSSASVLEDGRDGAHVVHLNNCTVLLTGSVHSECTGSVYSAHSPNMHIDVRTIPTTNNPIVGSAQPLFCANRVEEQT